MYSQMCLDLAQLGLERRTDREEYAISTGRLTSGLPYQRPVEEKEVDRLVREWDDRLLEPLAVNLRDGKLYLVDGQHRVAALRKMHGGQEVMAVCKVYVGLTYEEEAALCFKLDKAKKRLSLSHATNALAESGSDAEVAAIRRLAEANGFTWALGKKTGRNYEISAARAIINAYRLLGGAAFSRMLALMNGAWHGSPDSLKALMISGMALFLKTYEMELNDHIFIRQLAGVEPGEIIRRSKTDFSTNRAALRYARVLREKYNGQLRGSARLPYRFKD